MVDCNRCRLHLLFSFTAQGICYIFGVLSRAWEIHCGTFSMRKFKCCCLVLLFALRGEYAVKKKWCAGNLNLLPSSRFVGRQVVQFPYVNCVHVNTVD
uniref:Uncharacterized protein n=1 Tax=Rhipicephalus zambeziensis TaxID=60191 RepID=A0A224Y891_9ACAR